jgi:hypothetical protein
MVGKPRAAAGTVTEGARVRVGLSGRKVWRVMPLRTHTSTCTAMEEGDPIHDVFSSDRLWQQPSFIDDDDDIQGSSFFAPLQLDSKQSRDVFAQTCERVQ